MGHGTEAPEMVAQSPTSLGDAGTRLPGRPGRVGVRRRGECQTSNISLGGRWVLWLQQHIDGRERILVSPCEHVGS